MTLIHELEQVLRRRFPTTDVRADQCDMIRLISTIMAAGCSEKEGSCHATVIALTARDIDYEDELVADIQEPTPERLADRLAEFF